MLTDLSLECLAKALYFRHPRIPTDHISALHMIGIHGRIFILNLAVFPFQLQLPHAATDSDELAEVGSHARELILNAGLPTEVEGDIHKAYLELCKDACSAESQYPSVQIRAAPSDVWPDSAFAGHQASVVDVRGIEDVTTAVLECFATIFSDAAIAYRANHGIDHFGVHGAIAVSRMDVARRAWAPVDDTSVSVVDTSRPDKGFRDVTILQHHSFRPRA